MSVPSPSPSPGEGTPLHTSSSNASLCSQSATPKQRKKPHCKTCGAPRLGHKIGQCTPTASTFSPVVDTPTKLRKKPVGRSVEDAEDLTHALMELSLQRAKRVTDGDAMEVTPTTKATAETSPLNHPFAPDDKTTSAVTFEDDEGLDRFVGSCGSSISGYQPASSSADSNPAAAGVPLVEAAGKGVGGSVGSDPPKRDGAEAILRFIHEKSKAPPVSLYAFPSADIAELEEKATAHGVPIRIIDMEQNRPKKRKKPEGSYAHVLVGKEGQSINGAMTRVEGTAAGKSVLSTALGSGAAVGAVVTWMYLAFS